MSHFLDEAGNISETAPKQSRELASFLALIVDNKTKKKAFPSNTDAIRCFEKGCSGEISSEFSDDGGEINWKCSKCDNAGSISGWLDTKWDNSR